MGKLKPYYQDEFVTLYQGDCLKHSALWASADVLVTDPPYGYSHKSGGGPRGNATWKNSTIANDDDTAARDQVLEKWGDKPAIVFGSWKRPRPKATKAMLIWDKGGHAGMGDLSIPWKPNFEEIYIIGAGFNGRRSSGVLSGYHNPPNEASGRSHQHQKPSNLMEDLIVKSPAGIVADPFAGSGSTLVAAKKLGRKVIGFELEERYCEIIAKRCSQGVLNFGVYA